MGFKTTFPPARPGRVSCTRIAALIIHLFAGMRNLASSFTLAFGFCFQDLYSREGLLRLDATFLERLKGLDVALFNSLMQARANPEALSRKQESELIIALAPHLEDLVGDLFGI